MGFKGKNPKFCISDEVSASVSPWGTHRAEKQSQDYAEILPVTPASLTSSHHGCTPNSYIESTLMRLLCFLDERTPFFFYIGLNLFKKS